MALKVEKAKEKVLKTARRMFDMGLVMGTWGNVSTSPEPDIMVITPSGMNYHDTIFADMVMVNYKTKQIEGQRVPSVETPMHCRIYNDIPEVKAIVHTHSTYALALAVAGLELPPVTEEMASILGAGVGITDYAPSGSDDLAKNVVQALQKNNQKAVFLANHGLIATAEELEDALSYCAIIEKAAQIYLHAKAVGNPRVLNAEEIDKAQRFYKEQYGQRVCEN